MKIITFFIFLISFIPTFAQRPTPPKWDNDFIEITTAKIANYDIKLKKRGDDKFKDATIMISNPGLENCKIAVNIPDVYYMESADCSNFEYKEDSNGLSVSFSGSFYKRFVLVFIQYSRYSDKPEFIIVNWVEDVTKKPPTPTQVILSEIKTF